MKKECKFDTDSRSGQDNELLDVALIGRGRMGVHHLRSIVFNRLANIVAIADPMIRGESMVTINGTKIPVFRNANELFDKASPDVVHIVTPPPTHFDLARLALMQGAHVYVEKPVVLHRTEAEVLYKLASEKNLSLCAGHQLLFENPVYMAQSLIPQVGRIVHIESYFSFNPTRRSITAVEQLIDILPHPVCLLIHYIRMCEDASLNDNTAICNYIVSRRGEIRAIIKHGEIYGMLVVTLRGRPVESYVKITGTNGSLYLDFVRGTVTALLGSGASAVSMIINPYKQASQIVTNTTKAFLKLATSKDKSYHGLSVLIEAFYRSIVEKKPTPISRESVIHTVDLCERLAISIQKEEDKFEEEARARLEREEKVERSENQTRGTVLVTGGTGFLGKNVVRYILQAGWFVRVVTRKNPPYSQRIPTVEYVVLDLSGEIDLKYLENVHAVIHCAAETAGSLEMHNINTVKATINLLEACGRAKINKFIYISSIAVLKSGGVIDENTQLESGNFSRGPYVWAKAEAEKYVLEMQAILGLKAKIIRLGPLVDYSYFQPPGRLGKEVGSLFVVVGDKKSRISVCDVKLAVHIIGNYLEHFDALPDLLNVIEPDPHRRQELVDLIKRDRPGLKILWLPFWILAMSAPILKIIQKRIFHQKNPIDVCSIFASEKYNVARLQEVIKTIESQDISKKLPNS